MPKESPTDKLLEASGLQRAKPAQQTPEERVEEMVDAEMRRAKERSVMGATEVVA